MQYSRIVRAVYSSVWAILPEKLQAIAEFLHLRVSGGTVAPEIVAAIRKENAVSAARMQALSADKPGSVMVLPLFGIINQRYAGDFSGPSGTSVQQFTQQFRQAMNDPNVKAIVIDVDSPGGTVSGVAELATEIYNARKQGTKKITAVSDCLCASAAYWIASQCNEVCVSPSSLTGSVGVYQLHEDDSKMLEEAGVKVTLISAGAYKTEGNSYEPLGDEARTAMQAMVDDFYGMFTKAVARGRGVAVKAVTGGFGQGRVLTAQDAVKQGLADRVATLDDVLAGFGVKQQSASATGGTPAPSAMGNARADDDTTIDDDIEDAEGGDCACACDACAGGDCGSCTHEGCDPEAEGCEGCGMAGDDEGAAAAQSADADRERRLRIARL